MSFYVLAFIPSMPAFTKEHMLTTQMDTQPRTRDDTKAGSKQRDEIEKMYRWLYV